MTHLYKFLSCLIVFALLAIQPLSATAQRRKPSRRSLPPRQPAMLTPQPVRQSAQSVPDVQSGDVSVKVTANGNATVRLGLAPHGVTFIEFPANDPIYGVHPGDENFATVDTKNRRVTDALVIRPGKKFVEMPNSTEPPPSTVITVQRVSGIVVSFIIVPVVNINQNANRVVVSYNLAEVLAARRRAGLVTNLVTPDQLVAAGVSLPEANPSEQPGTDSPTPTPSPSSPSPQQPDAVPSSEPATPLPVSVTATVGTEEKVVDDPRLLTVSERTIAELQRVGSAGLPLRFGKPIHGLSLALTPQTPHSSRTSAVAIEIVAVRNTLSQAVRLVPDQPELYIESRPERGSASVNSARVPVLYVATTVGDDDVLQPGIIYYFAVAYESPLLGAKQSLRIGFAQTNATDEPISADLVVNAR